MSGTLTASQRLKEIYDKRKTEDAEIEKLKKDAEAEDLETVKALITEDLGQIYQCPYLDDANIEASTLCLPQKSRMD
jgi:hypothetical protein